MNIFCLNRFKEVFEDLNKKKPYKTLESEVINYFFNREFNSLLSGTRLNNSAVEPYIKKRFEGSGGFRIYFLAVIKTECIYLMFVHPKTGPSGSDNITDESKALIYKEVLAAIKSNDLFELTLSEDGCRIEFTKAK